MSDDKGRVDSPSITDLLSEPDTAEYRRLLSLMEALVHQAESTPDLAERLRGVIDARAVTYAAMARAVPFMGVSGPAEMQARMEEAWHLIPFWLEAFHLGVLFERGRPDNEEES